jgi:polyisoprenoid-binding protein YceI
MKSKVLLLPAALLASAAGLFGQETVIELDPARTQVQFTLNDVLHTVKGSFQLTRGSVDYDLAAGRASGEIVIDARSGESGNAARDKRMHKTILESERYPEIAFVPDRVEGTLLKANMHGVFRIHGAAHEMTVTIKTQPDGDKVDVATQFVVPYVEWGMKNPSTLFLRCSDKVNINMRGVGRVRLVEGSR